MNEKITILILIENFLPGTKSGGPITSVINLINTLEERFNFKVLTYDRDLGDDKPYKDIESSVWVERKNYKIKYIPKTIFSIFSIINSINKIQPELIYIKGLLNPIFSIAVVLSYKLKLIKNRPLIIAPSGELFDEAIHFKTTKKKIFLNFSKITRLYKKIFWHASTEEEKKSILRYMSVQANKIFVALNLIDFSESLPLARSEELNASTSLNMVYLARISKDKNLPFAFEVLQKVKAPVIFDIYGPIEDDYIWEECLKKQAQLPPNIVVNYKGIVNREVVKLTLSQYDLFFLPTYSENFGHAIAEALLAGTPVLISDKTPWKALETHGLGWEFPLNQPSQFIEVVEKLSQLSREQRNLLKINTQANFKKFMNMDLAIQQHIDLFSVK